MLRLLIKLPELLELLAVGVDRQTMHEIQVRVYGGNGVSRWVERNALLWFSPKNYLLAEGGDVGHEDETRVVQEAEAEYENGRGAGGGAEDVSAEEDDEEEDEEEEDEEEEEEEDSEDEDE